MQNILATIFDIESEGYQAITTLKQHPITKNTTILQMALVKRTGKTISVCDSFDSGINTNNDTILGGLLGGLIGVLGGPIGILLMGSYGTLAGSMIDNNEAINTISMMETVANKLQDGTIALIALVEEDNENDLDKQLFQFKAEIIRFDAAEIANQVEEAKRMQIEMERITRQQLRATKKADFQKKIEEKRAKIAADFEAFKTKFNKK